MSRQIINRILFMLFVVAICGMGILYVKQEQSISRVENEYSELVNKEEKVKYMISEYNILIDSVNSKNYIVRIARDMFGWVFYNEVLYTKPLAKAPNDNSAADNDILDSNNK